MKKAKKIGFVLLVCTTVLFGLITLFFSLSSVQTAIARYITNAVNKSYQINLQIQEVYISIYGGIDFKNLKLLDDEKELLFSARHLNTSIVGAYKIFKGNLAFSKFSISGLEVGVKTLKEHKQSNWEIFISKLKSDDDSSKSTINWSVSEISLTNAKIEVVDDNLLKNKSTILKNLNLNINDLRSKNDSITLSIKALSVNTNKGINLKNLSANVLVSDKVLQLSNFKIQTKRSVIRAPLVRLRNDKSIYDWLSNHIELRVANSRINTYEIQPFLDTYIKPCNLSFNITAEGTLNDISVKNLYINTGQSFLKAFGKLNNLRHNSSVSGDLRVSMLHIEKDDVLNLLADNTKKQLFSDFLDPLNFVNVSGHLSLKDNILKSLLYLESPIGKIEGNSTWFKANDLGHSNQSTTLKFVNFNFGKLLHTKSIGFANLTASAFGGNGLNTESPIAIEVHTDDADLNGRNYKKLNLIAKVYSQKVEWLLNVFDQNLKLELLGNYDYSSPLKYLNLNLDLKHADINYLSQEKIIDSDNSLKCKIALSLNGKSFEDIAGQVNISNMTFESSESKYMFRNFSIKSLYDDGLKSITIDSPDFISGNMRGVFKYKDLGSLIKNTLLKKPKAVAEGVDDQVVRQFLEYDLSVNNLFFDAFCPKLAVSDSTYLKGRLVENQLFKISISSPWIKANGIRLESVEVNIDNTRPYSYIKSSKIKYGSFYISDLMVQNKVTQDSLFFETTFSSGNNKENKYHLKNYFITKDDKTLMVVQPTELMVNNTTWKLSGIDDAESTVTFSKNLDSVYVDHIRFSNKKQSISITDGVIEPKYKNVLVNIEDILIETLIPKSQNVQIKGLANGLFHIFQDENTSITSTKLYIEDIVYNKSQLGQLSLSVAGNSKQSDYFVIMNLANQNQSLLTQGRFSKENEHYLLDLTTLMNNFQIAPFSPKEGAIQNIRGVLNGEVKLQGFVEDLIPSGNLVLEKAGLSISDIYLDVALADRAYINVTPKGLMFKDVKIVDTKYKTQAVIGGGITCKNLTNWGLDIDIDSENKKFLAIDIPRKSGALFYGTVFVKGNVEVNGAFGELITTLNAETADESTFFISIEESTNVVDNSFVEIKPKTALLKKRKRKTDTISLNEGDNELKINLKINPSTEVGFLMGDYVTVKGFGSGNIKLSTNYKNAFNLWGSFMVDTGECRLQYSKFFQKDFNITPNGSISWNGDPYRGVLKNVSAKHRLYANPDILLETPRFNRKIATEVILNLRGDVSNPDIEFDISFPETTAESSSELQSQLSTVEKRQLQGISLLSQGTFINQYLATDYALRGNLAESISNIFSSLINSEDDKINIGLNYESQESIFDKNLVKQGSRVGVTLSSRLSDRVFFNGRIGVPTGGVNTSSVIGEGELQIMLNKERTLSAKIYNRRADYQDFLGGQINYVKGAAISYRTNFSRFKDLLNKIFSKAKK